MVAFLIVAGIVLILAGGSGFVIGNVAFKTPYWWLSFACAAIALLGIALIALSTKGIE